MLAPVAAVLATILAIVWAGLSPFEFDPKNRVSWLRHGPGVLLAGDAMIRSDGILAWPEGAAELTVEAWFRPAEEPRTHLARLLALYDAEELPALSLDQWGAAFIVRDRRRGRNEGWAYREHAVQDVLRSGRPRYVAVTSGSQGTKVYLDGEPTGLETTASVIGEGENLSGQLLLGNSARGGQEWAGEIYGLAFYDRELPGAEIARHAAMTAGKGVSVLASSPSLLALYPFSEGVGAVAASLVPSVRLEIPTGFQPMRRTILRWPQANDRRYGWYWRDVVFNVLGFLPLGFFVAFTLRRWGEERTWVLLLASTSLAATLSLGIELTQVMLPSRVSSLTDLSSNILGGLMGSVGAHFARGRSRKSAAAQQPTSAGN